MPDDDRDDICLVPRVHDATAARQPTCVARRVLAIVEAVTAIGAVPLLEEAATSIVAATPERRGALFGISETKRVLNTGQEGLEAAHKLGQSQGKDAETEMSVCCYFAPACDR